MTNTPEKRAVRGPKGPVQTKKVREGCWTARKRGIFLAHLAATSNVTEAARAAGMHVRSAYYLRARDAQFAAEWDEALDVAEARLTGKMVVYAETQGATAPAGDGEAELAGFDPKLAMETLNLYRNRRGGGGRRPRGGGPKPYTATREETEAAVMALLKKLGKRLAGRKR